MSGVDASRRALCVKLSQPSSPPDPDDVCECEHYADEHGGAGGACKALHPRAFSRCSCPAFLAVHP